MQDYNVLNNTSLLSTISKADLYKICEIEELVIGNFLSNLNDDKSTGACFDIGIGNLILEWNDDDIVFNFIPSERFSDIILKGLDKDSELVKRLEEAITSKINSAYKDLLC